MRKFREKYNLERVTPYGLRRSFATLCAENGMDKLVLMKLLGHSNYETSTRYYIKVSPKRLQQAMQSIFNFPFNQKELS